MRLALRVLCFLLALHNVYCFPNLWRRITGRRIRGDQTQDQINYQDISKTAVDDTEVQIPEKLFSSVASRKISFCHQARVEFDKLCSLHSAFERMKLASLVTNCHLEVSGRPVFEWDPVKRLGDAESDYIHLVMQFLPLMSDVCQKAGYNPFLAQLAADATSNDDLRSRIIELQYATKRLFEANRDASKFIKDYTSASDDASKKLTEILKISAAIKDANDAIDFQKESFHQEADNIKNELQEFNKQSLSLFNSMFGRFEGFQSQMDNMADTVGQIQSDSRVTSMFLKEPLKAISNTSVTEFSQASSLSDNTSSPFLSVQKLWFLKKLILGPLKLSERIRQLESNSFLGPIAKDVFSSVQLLLVLLSVYIAYVVLTTVTRIVEAVVHFAAVLRPSQPLLVRLARLFKNSDQPQTRFQGLDMEQKLSEHMSANISKALSSASVAEKFADIVRKEGTDDSINLLLTRISEIDTRLFRISQDVHSLRHAFQSINREDTAAVSDNRDRSSKHQNAAERSEIAISTPKDCLQDEQLECPNDQSVRTMDRRESDAIDHSLRRSPQKTGTKTPRRELKRRRSSRKKV